MSLRNSIRHKLAGFFLTRAQSIMGANDKLRVVLSENTAYLDIVDEPTSAEQGYVFEDYYENVALFFQGVANEVDVSPVFETKEIDGSGHGELAGLDVQTSTYIRKYMQQKVFEDMIFTRARRSIADSATLQYLILGVLALVVVLLVYNVA